MRKGGRLYEITEGDYAGKFAYAEYTEQKDVYLNDGKLVVKLFHDYTLQKKITLPGSVNCFVIKATKLKQIGFVD